MIVGNPSRASSGGTIAPDDFADIAECTGVDWLADGALEITFSRPLTGAEQATVRLRCASASDVEVTLRQQASDAMQTNREFLALTSPTEAQNTAQTRALTHQVQALIRLSLGQFDGTD